MVKDTRREEIERPQPVPPIRGLVAIRRISWGAVFAGVVIALVGQLILSILGLGIGASRIESLGKVGAAIELGTMAGIWFVTTGLLALFIGGWVAGRLAGVPRHIDGMLHGMLAWGITTLVTIYLVTTAVGGLLSGATSIVGGAVGLLSQGVWTAAPTVATMNGTELERRGVNFETIIEEARQTLEETGKQELAPSRIERRAGRVAGEARKGVSESLRNPEVAETELRTILRRVLLSGKAILDAADREALVNVLIARTDMSRQEAETEISR